MYFKDLAPGEALKETGTKTERFRQRLITGTFRQTA